MISSSTKERESKDIPFDLKDGLANAPQEVPKPEVLGEQAWGKPYKYSLKCFESKNPCTF